MKLQIIRLTVVSPEHILFEGTVEHVVLPGTAGAFAVFPEHAPIISSLTKGKMVYTKDGKPNTIEIKSGFVEVEDNNVSVCVEQ